MTPDGEHAARSDQVAALLDAIWNPGPSNDVIELEILASTQAEIDQASAFGEVALDRMDRFIDALRLLVQFRHPDDAPRDLAPAMLRMPPEIRRRFDSLVMGFDPED